MRRVVAALAADTDQVGVPPAAIPPPPGTSRRTVARQLDRLVSSGAVERLGASRAVRYRMVE